ncbi:hypothetical protein M3Y99_00156300 [Aphelenchoides fujianensis]|nr:hypothetical protein M3Y99_00156300 [Aphelenchoides fujianensis]
MDGFGRRSFLLPPPVFDDSDEDAVERRPSWSPSSSRWRRNARAWSGRPSPQSRNSRTSFGSKTTRSAS